MLKKYFNPHTHKDEKFHNLSTQYWAICGASFLSTHRSLKVHIVDPFGSSVFGVIVFEGSLNSAFRNLLRDVNLHRVVLIESPLEFLMVRVLMVRRHRLHASCGWLVGLKSGIKSTFLAGSDPDLTVQGYSATEKHSAYAVVLSMHGPASHLLFSTFLSMLFLMRLLGGSFRGGICV